MFPLSEDLYTLMTSNEMREQILHMTNPAHFHIDLKSKDTDVPQESFRKLNID